VIKFLNDQSKDLENELKDLEEKNLKREAKEDPKNAGGKSNEELLNFLEHKLEEIESKLSSTQANYDSL